MKHVVNILRIEFCLAFLWAAVIVLLFEADGLEAGDYVEDGMATYCINLAGILMMLVSLPFALKLMTFRRVKSRFETGDEAVTLRAYRRWSEVRIALLSATMWCNICFYYLTQTNTGCMCALIAVLGLCFCFPSVDKLVYETGMKGSGCGSATDKK